MPTAAAAAERIRAHFIDVFELAFGRRSETPGVLRVVTGQAHPLGNLLLVDPGADPAVVVEAAEPLLVEAFPSAVVLTGGDSPQLATAIRPLGYVLAEQMALMGVTPDALADTPLAEGYSFVEVDAERGAAWNAALADGYGIPPALAERFGPGRVNPPPPGRVRYFAAERGGVFAAVSMMYVAHGSAGIYCVATREGHRRRGLGAHLTAEPLRLAWHAGVAAGLLQASAMGEPVYRRLGFETFGEMALYVRVPGGATGDA